MNTRFIVRFCSTIIVCFLFGIHTHNVSAASLSFKSPEPQFFVASDVYELSSTSTRALYSITYQLRAFGGDMYIPLGAARRIGGEPAGWGGAEYTILNGDFEIENKGTTVGAVLSTSTIENGMYKIPNGETRRFTLFALFDNRGNEGDHYRMSLDRTRFYPRSATTTPESDDVSARDYRTDETFLVK